jgi:hypothetical protein
VDASGIPHFGIAKYSLVIKKANSNQLRRAIQLAREDAHVLLADYPREILTTGHDNELCQAIGNVKEDEIEYLGAMFYGPTANVDAITRKFSLWK